MDEENMKLGGQVIFGAPIGPGNFGNVAVMPRAPQPGVTGMQSSPYAPTVTPITSIAGSEWLPREIKDALAQASQQQGFSAPELAAARAQMAAVQQAGEKARQRATESQLAQAGIRGGAAFAARQRAAQLAEKEKGMMGQELFLKDVAQKMKEKQDYQNMLKEAFGAAQRGQFLDISSRLGGLALQQSQEQEQQAKKMFGEIG